MDDGCGISGVIIMTNKINFSHKYQKLFKINIEDPVELIYVMKVDNLNGFSEEFLKYDTLYFKEGNAYQYFLDRTMPHLILFFQDYNGALFTTIRRSKPLKDQYYLGLVGKVFDVEINE